MSINLRDIITKEDINTLSELKTSDVMDSKDLFDTYMKSWQRELDYKFNSLQAKRRQYINTYWDRMAVFTKWFAGAGASVLFVIWMVSGMLGCAAQRNQKRIDAGYVFINDINSEIPIKNAPSGVYLISSSVTRINKMDAKNTTVTFVLNLPSISSNKMYVINHTVLEDDDVWGSGLSYTKPGQSGLLQFEKEYDFSAYYLRMNRHQANALKINVKVMDADPSLASK